MIYNSSCKYYDDEKVFKEYVKLRSARDALNNTLEEPSFFELTGDVKGKKILDLGCGFGYYSYKLMDRGASVVALDGSSRMVELAQKNYPENDRLKFMCKDLEKYDYPMIEYDMVVSNLVIHYVRDLGLIFDEVYKTLKESGKFVFSVEHPFITMQYSQKSSGKPNGVDYFGKSRRVVSWLGAHVIKYHRNVEVYIKKLISSGFSIDDIVEPSGKGKFQKTHPHFLLIKATKVQLH